MIGQLASTIRTDGKQYYDYLETPTTSCMFLKTIVEEEIVRIIYKFNQNKSVGHDDIGNFIVKRITKEISVPLTLIFNTSISTGTVPDELKMAKVIPIYKKIAQRCSQTIDLSQCYHVSQKMLERLVFNRCMNCLDTYDILNKKQFGFRCNHSTYMAILELVDKISMAVENNETTVGIFLDLSKAFDTIDHKFLLYKLEYYGFRGNVLKRYTDYLYNRKQYVLYNSCKSDHKYILCGRPQGSILGPLLFILYVNGTTNIHILI